MKVTVGISNHHVHLTRDDLDILFGKNYELNQKYNLNQPGQFASLELVTIKTAKSQIENVRILGPVRNYTQVEISKTDAYKLGINPPLRDSGDVLNSEIVTIVGPKGEITKECCIIARRHIHVTPKEKEMYELPDVVKVKINTSRGGILDQVHVKVAEQSYYEMHVDTDEANAFDIINETIGEIEK